MTYQTPVIFDCSVGTWCDWMFSYALYCSKLYFIL